MLAAALMLFTLSAWFADVIGLHAVFGSFLIGTAMPRGVFAVRLKQLLEPFTLVFLLPVFFTLLGPQHATHDGEYRAAAGHRARRAGGVHLRQVRRVLGRGARLRDWTIAARSESARS